MKPLLRLARNSLYFESTLYHFGKITSYQSIVIIPALSLYSYYMMNFLMFRSWFYVLSLSQRKKLSSPLLSSSGWSKN